MALTAVTMLCWQGSALAATAGGATIHNVATVTFDGGSSTASVDVTVSTVAAAPTLQPSATTLSVGSGSTANYSYTITNNSNGSDTFALSANSVDVGMASAPTFDLNSTATASDAITLGGAVTSLASDATGSIYIPAGAEINFDVGETIVVSGIGSYTIASISPGSVASTTGGVTTPESPTTMTLTPISGPAVVAGTIPAGTQFGEQLSFTLAVTASTPTASTGTHTINLSGTTTAITSGSSGTVVSFATDAATGNESVLTVVTIVVDLIQEARNVTLGHAFGAVPTVTGQPGDVLEFRLTATPGAGSVDATGNVLVNDLPPFTSYVAASTTLNGAAVTDGAGATLPLTSANGGMTINSPSGTSGVIVAGESAVITFRVTVN